MEGFTQYLIGEEKEVPTPNLKVIILGEDDEPGSFADLIQKVSKKLGISAIMIDIDKVYIASQDVEKGGVSLHNINEEADNIDISIHDTIVFVRGGAIKNQTTQALVSSLQSIGFFLVNDLQSMILCDNKMAAAIELERNNIPIPRTSIINNIESIESAHKKIGGKFPIIIKTLKGTQGVGVSKVNDMTSLISVCQSLWKFNADILIQEFLDIESDVRTLVLNGQILASAERKNESSDFRHNVHLGAKTQPYKLSEFEKNLVLKAARATGAVYCGVDHCKYKDNFYILEINGSPGIKSHFMGYNKEHNPTKKISDGQVLIKIIKRLSLESHRRPQMRQEVGYIESILLDGMEKNLIRAKFDTGNSSSATMLHVDKLEIKGDMALWKKNGVSYESEIIDISKPNRGKKQFDVRPVIEHGVTFMNRKYNIELGLTEKDTASEMLVNRKTMTQFRVSVNPNRKYMVSDYAGADDDYTRD
tara:strand:+ start:5674 stop:7101 length:1428 start_codon:yes stop_codon:yes gene_type:complete